MLFSRNNTFPRIFLDFLGASHNKNLQQDTTNTHVNNTEA